MSTECNQFIFGFHTLNHREIRAQFDGGAITTEGGGLLPTDSANVTSTPESSPCSSPNRCALRFFLLPADSVVVVDRERRIALKAKHSRRRKKVIHFRLSYCRPLPPRSLSNFHGTRQIWRKRGGVEPTHVRIARDDLYRNCVRLRRLERFQRQERRRKISKLLFSTDVWGWNPTLGQFRCPAVGVAQNPLFAQRIGELLSEFCPKTTPDQAQFACTNQEARVWFYRNL